MKFKIGDVILYKFVYLTGYRTLKIIDIVKNTTYRMRVIACDRHPREINTTTIEEFSWIDENSVLAQSYYNEQKMKKLLGVE